MNQIQSEQTHSNFNNHCCRHDHFHFVFSDSTFRSPDLIQVSYSLLKYICKIKIAYFHWLEKVVNIKYYKNIEESQVPLLENNNR